MANIVKTFVLQLYELDKKYCLKLNKFSTNKIILKFFNFISWLSNGKIWYLIILTTALSSKVGIKISFELISFGLMGTIIYKLLKYKINRPRPYKINQSIHLGGKILDQFSFPSGHTLSLCYFFTHTNFLFPNFYRDFNNLYTFSSLISSNPRYAFSIRCFCWSFFGIPDF